MLRLLLFRHAKTARESGGGDHDRPLTKRGEEDSKRIGRYLSDEQLLPDLVVASDSRRTRQTLDLALKAAHQHPQTRLDRAVYLAEPHTLLGVIRRTPAEVRTLMLIGHAPGMADLGTLLTGFGDRYAFARMTTKFPTSGLAVLDFPVERWDEVKERSGRLDRFVTPASLDSGVEDD
ncbi:MAG: phosphohistidine phosphatase [Methylobacteriaceae bacterium]|jgi:phosphohistidine phosphatase|nr:phosphohistidine phosphatase [Methylobacteriaceae bacterium]